MTMLTAYRGSQVLWCETSTSRVIRVVFMFVSDWWLHYKSTTKLAEVKLVFEIACLLGRRNLPSSL